MLLPRPYGMKAVLHLPKAPYFACVDWIGEPNAVLYADHKLHVFAKASPRGKPHRMVKDGHTIDTVSLLLREDPFGDLA